MHYLQFPYIMRFGVLLLQIHFFGDNCSMYDVTLRRNFSFYFIDYFSRRKMCQTKLVALGKFSIMLRTDIFV